MKRDEWILLGVAVGASLIVALGLSFVLFGESRVLGF